MQKIDAVFLSIILIVSGFYVGVNYVSSFSGVSKTMGDDFIEVDDLNATGSWYRGTTNLTDRLLGTWGALIADTLDTGQGAYELYDMDQNVKTTDKVTFANISADGVDVDWVDLGGVNRTTWPSGGGGGASEEYPYTYLVFINATATYAISGDTGQIEFQNADSDVVLNSSTASDGLIIVKGGTYEVNDFNPSGDVIIQGEGQDQTIFNITDANIGIEQNGPTVWRDLQFYSLDDGIAHMVIDENCTFERVLFKFECHGETSEAGFLYYRATGNSYAEFYDITLILGDGTAAKTTYFFSWDADFDHLYVDGLIVEKYDCGTGYGRAFTTHNADTMVQTISVKNVDIMNWTASGASDSALVHDTDLAVDILTVENILFRAGSFTGGTQQVMITGPMANTQIIRNIIANEGARIHFYGGRGTTILDGFVFHGDVTLTSAFDMGVQGTYPREITVSNGHIFNGSLSINSGYSKVVIVNVNFFGSRLWIGDEDPAADNAGIRDIHITNVHWHFNDTDGDDAYNRAIEFQSVATMDGLNIVMDTITLRGLSYFFYAGGSTFTVPTNITISKARVYPAIGTSGPIFAECNPRDANLRLTILDSYFYLEEPPFDQYWNPIQAGDVISGVTYVDVDTGTEYYSECAYNWTIPSGSSSVALSHDLPQRGPESFYTITLTSDPANCTGVYAAWSDFTNTDIDIRAFDSGAEKIVNDDVTGIIMFWLTRPNS